MGWKYVLCQNILSKICTLVLCWKLSPKKNSVLKWQKVVQKKFSHSIFIRLKEILGSMNPQWKALSHLKSQNTFRVEFEFSEPQIIFYRELRYFAVIKGQLISKCPFGVFKSNKKHTRNFLMISSLASKKRLNKQNKSTFFF